MQNAAIIYLVKSDSKDIYNLLDSLEKLETNFLKQFPYPVILFHEKSLSNEWKANILLNCPDLDIRFALVEFNRTRQHNTNFDIGYCNMCQWFAGEFAYHPALSGLHYYLRLDTDSFILSPILYDVFEFMAYKFLDYGYITTMGDADHTTIGLWDAVDEFINTYKSYSVMPNIIKESDWNRGVFYNNFEIANLGWIRSDEYQKFFWHLKNKDGYFMHRWGDHATRYLAQMLFPVKIHQFKDIHYKHQDYVNAPN